MARNPAYATIWHARKATRDEKRFIGYEPRAELTALLDSRKQLLGLVWQGEVVAADSALVTRDALQSAYERRRTGWPQPNPRPDLLIHNIAREILDGTSKKGNPKWGCPEWVQSTVFRHGIGHSAKTIRDELELIAIGEPSHNNLSRDLLSFLVAQSEARAAA